VDDFAGLGGGAHGGLAPLEGGQSLWCGVRPTDPDACYYGSAPGYGHGWWQRFESVPFSVTGAVTISGIGRFDSESTYDITWVEYLSKSGTWRWIGKFDQIGHHQPRDTTFSLTVPADSIDGTVRFRLLFTSDGAWDDEDGIVNTDGASIIDSLTIADSGGVVDYQDFESEAVGALSTSDGDWTAKTRPAFGDHAALFDGLTVLQEDSLTTNTSYFWGFFDNSQDDYACGGFPGQAVVPFGKPAPYWANDVYIYNEVWSPPIAIGQDINGNAITVPDSITLEYDVYEDFTGTTAVFYDFRVRCRINGCWQDWKDDNTVSGTEEKTWVHRTHDLSQFILTGTSHIQIALGVRDMCGGWCTPIITGYCHTHSPLFDDVRVTGLNTVTGVRPETAATGFRLHQNIPNPFNPTTTIAYDIPAGGAFVEIAIYDARGKKVRTVIAQDVGEGRHEARWEGTDNRGARVASGVYFYRMRAGSFTSTRKLVLLK